MPRRRSPLDGEPPRGGPVQGDVLGVPLITVRGRAGGEPNGTRVPPAMTDSGLSVCLIVKDAAATLELGDRVGEGPCGRDLRLRHGIARRDPGAPRGARNRARSADHLRGRRVARRLRLGARTVVRALVAAVAHVPGRRRRRGRRRAPAGPGGCGGSGRGARDQRRLRPPRRARRDGFLALDEPDPPPGLGPLGGRRPRALAGAAGRRDRPCPSWSASGAAPSARGAAEALRAPHRELPPPIPSERLAVR